MKRAFYFIFICFLPLLALPQHTIFDPATYTLAASLPSNMEIVDYQGDSYLRIITGNAPSFLTIEAFTIPSDIETIKITQMYKIGDGNGPIESTKIEVALFSSTNSILGNGIFNANSSLSNYYVTTNNNVVLGRIAILSTMNDSPIQGDTIYISNIETYYVENNAPIASAGNDQSVYEGELVTLSAVGSMDPDGDQITFSWTAPTGIFLSSRFSVQPTFTAPQVDVDTDLEFTLVVNDGEINSEPDTVIVTVKKNTNNTPTANAGPDQNVDEGDVVTLDGTASSDPDSDPLTYLWTAPSGITLSSNTASQPTFTAPQVSTATPYEFTLVVNDGTTDSERDTVVVTVNNVNQAPTANAGPDQIVDEGDLVTLNGTSSSDPDSDPLTYLWTAPAGITLSSNTASQPTFTAPEVSTATPYEFTLVVNDGTTDSERDTVIVTVNNVEGVPATLSVDNVVVGDGEERCYGASQTITVAENGPVVANNNSTVTFIAGESIVFYPGFHAQPGSNVHAYITTNQTFCEAIKSQTIVSANTNFDISINEETLQTEGSILVFPNPNNGRFTLQLQNYDSHAQVMVVNLAGKVIYQTTVNESGNIEIDMLNAPHGIYSIVVSDNKTVKTSKMVVY